jgi:hypothetical protein
MHPIKVLSIQNIKRHHARVKSNGGRECIVAEVMIK